MLSINIAKNVDNNMKVIKMGMLLYLTILAMRIQSQRKKPTRAMPSTMIIIPMIKRIVSQLIPFEVSDAVFA